MAILGCPLLLPFLAEVMEPETKKNPMQATVAKESQCYKRHDAKELCTSLQLSPETIPQISSVQTEQQHRFDGGIMQLTKPWELQCSCFHWKACQQRKTRLHVKSS